MEFDIRLFVFQLRPLIELESGMVIYSRYRIKFVNHIGSVTCVCARLCWSIHYFSVRGTIERWRKSRIVGLSFLFIKLLFSLILSLCLLSLLFPPRKSKLTRSFRFLVRLTVLF
jgi:hypothetical protein